MLYNHSLLRALFTTALGGAIPLAGSVLAQEAVVTSAAPAADAQTTAILEVAEAFLATLNDGSSWTSTF